MTIVPMSLRKDSCNLMLKEFISLFLPDLCLLGIRPKSLGTAVLIYTIIEKGTVDVGSVINAHLNGVIKGTRTSGYCFPHLITELCRASKVVWSEGLEILPAWRLLTFEYVRGEMFRLPRAAAARDAERDRSDQDEPVVEEGSRSVRDLVPQVAALADGQRTIVYR